LKPAETTPLSAIRLFELIEKAGFPPGSAQLRSRTRPHGWADLAESMLVDKIAFTGGTATGRKIMQAATSNIKKVTLDSVEKARTSSSPTRIWMLRLSLPCLASTRPGRGLQRRLASALGKKDADKFLTRLAEASNKIIVGDGMKPETEMGPLITPAHMEKVLGYIETGKREGAKLICGGNRLTKGELAAGNFVARRLRQNQAVDEDRARGNFRAGARGRNFSRRRRKHCDWRMTRSTDLRAPFLPVTAARVCAC
jgi:betaine-aldehyde dehydrogenase